MEPASNNVQNHLYDAESKIETAAQVARDYARDKTLIPEQQAAREIVHDGVETGRNDVAGYKQSIDSAINTASSTIADGVNAIRSSETLKSVQESAKPVTDRATNVVGQAASTASSTTSQVAAAVGNATAVAANVVIEVGQAGIQLAKQTASAIQSQGIGATAQGLATSAQERSAPVTSAVSSAVASAASAASHATHAVVDPLINAAMNMANSVDGEATEQHTSLTHEQAQAKAAAFDAKPVVVQPIVANHQLVVEE